MSIVKPSAAPAPSFPPEFEETLSRDRGRLLRLRGEARRPGAKPALRERYEAALAASRAAHAARRAQAPTPTFPEDLPVAREAERIVALIRSHQVVVVAGETGSGKTTQLPKLCLAAGRGVAGMIGCTQPRRIAARAVARRVAEELGSEIGGAVGFQVRFTDNVSERTHIKFMTDGILLAEIASDRWLSAYDTIIVDEAHERSLNIDFLLGFLKTLLARRPDLKLIVTSATIDTGRFAKHFGDAPVVDVAGRSHPVEVRWRGGAQAAGDDEEGAQEPRSMVEAIVAAMDEIAREDPRGDTLVFLPGEREIRDTHQALERRKYRETEVLPLYARLSARDQDRVFNPGPKRRIVLATNVAETSLTVPRIRYVIDPGVARVKRYSPRQKLDRLHIEKISQASANQRAGRCGRVAAGVCYRLYDESDFLSRPAFTDPEILRASLAGVILRMLDARLGRIEDFPFLEAPDPRAVADGWQQLVELGAVDDARRLTAVGRAMARMPVDPKLARILVAANAHGCLREALVICAFLGIQDPRERPADARQAADQAHAEFNDPRSEFVGVLNLWAAYRTAHEELTQSKLRDWCGKRFLGFLRMREWRELHRQLHVLVGDLGWAENSEPAKYPALHRALIAGLPTQVGHRADKQLYEGPRGRRYQVFPGSSLASKPPPWMLSAVLLDTQKVWGLMNAAIEPDWAIAELPHLLARRYHDPHWSRAQGRVIGSEQISLFGLVLAPRRPVHYGALFPLESREIFVREGLVPGEVDTRVAFLERNLATLEKAREEEAKLRRVGLVADADWQARWYLDRLPADINSAVALESWYRTLDAAGKAALQWSLAELLPGEGSEADRYPRYLALGDVRLAMHYRFEPGAEDDGVTLDVPLHLLNALDAARLSWLAPGFVEELATALIRGLPKAQRRNYVPAPDFARAFAEAFPQPSADSLPGELARFLSRATGAALAPTDFDVAALEPHLRMNVRLLDRSGRNVLAMSRDLDALRARFARDAERAFAAHAAQGMAREGLVAFPETPIPVSIPGDAGVPAYPALVDTGDAAALRVFADRAAADAAHPGGVRRLLAIALDDRIRQARRQLPVTPKTGLLYATIESADQLRGDLVEAALSAVLGDGLGGIRDAAAFEARREQAAKALFPEAVRRLELAEAILQAVGALRPALEAPLMGWARGNLDDLRAQLEALVHPGFLRETPAEALTEFPRYLRAMLLRAERAKRDPARDQQRMLEIAPFVQALAEARAAGLAHDPEWQALRWELEELRVSLFAQELGTRGAVSPKRLARRLEGLSRRG
ncbi:ATP-dependent RNA helicase HrpA [Coralloluteibacterium thermophilus]|uniref:ATP-dependent RNA helicase HrpA n=1 Tax=Coralloluteibacterium thermophilum TaxID=2707049 RepID=A0ABV9NJ86_9GAMM